MSGFNPYARHGGGGEYTGQQGGPQGAGGNGMRNGSPPARERVKRRGGFTDGPAPAGTPWEAEWSGGPPPGAEGGGGPMRRNEGRFDRGSPGPSRPFDARDDFRGGGGRGGFGGGRGGFRGGAPDDFRREDFRREPWSGGGRGGHPDRDVGRFRDGPPFEGRGGGREEVLSRSDLAVERERREGGGWDGPPGGRGGWDQQGRGGPDQRDRGHGGWDDRAPLDDGREHHRGGPPLPSRRFDSSPGPMQRHGSGADMRMDTSDDDWKHRGPAPGTASRESPRVAPPPPPHAGSDHGVSTPNSYSSQAVGQQPHPHHQHQAQQHWPPQHQQGVQAVGAAGGAAAIIPSSHAPSHNPTLQPGGGGGQYPGGPPTPMGHMVSPATPGVGGHRPQPPPTPYESALPWSAQQQQQLQMPHQQQQQMAWQHQGVPRPPMPIGGQMMGPVASGTPRMATGMTAQQAHNPRIASLQVNTAMGAGSGASSPRVMPAAWQQPGMCSPGPQGGMPMMQGGRPMPGGMPPQGALALGGMPSPHTPGWSSPFGAAMTPLSDRSEAQMCVCVMVPSGISEEVDKLELQARQARAELKEQQVKSRECYLERRAAEFRAAVAGLEVSLADAQYKTIQSKIIEMQHEALSA